MATSSDVAVVFVAVCGVSTIFAGWFAFEALLLAKRAHRAAREAQQLLVQNADNHLIFLSEMARKQGWSIEAELEKRRQQKKSQSN